MSQMWLLGNRWNNQQVKGKSGVQDTQRPPERLQGQEAKQIQWKTLVDLNRNKKKFWRKKSKKFSCIYGSCK